MPKVMVTLAHDPEQASLAGVCRLLGLEQGAVDESFGAVNISPAEHLYYTILVDEATATVNLTGLGEALVPDVPLQEGRPTLRVSFLE